MVLTTDLVCSGEVTEVHTDAPSWDDVTDAVNRLDGLTRTTLWLDDSEGSYIQVSGPVAGLFTVDLTLASGRYLHARDEEDSETLVSVPSGNDSVDLPRSTLVRRAIVDEALAHFLVEGTLAPNLAWAASE